MNNITKKRVLYFMPDNPVASKGGSVTRTTQLLDYFGQHADVLEVDFSSKKYWNEWTEEDIKNFKNRFPKIGLKIIDQRMKPKDLFNYLKYYKIPRLCARIFPKKKHIDSSCLVFKHRMRKLIKEKKYDIVIISYVSWGNFVNKNLDAYFILDSHDFMTVQYLQKEAIGKKLDIGREFSAEIDILKKFNEIWTYSIEEEYIFEQFTGKKVNLIPISFKADAINNFAQAKYPVVYVAGNNPHNVVSAKWYVDQVVPLLGDIKTYVVGSICDKMDDHPNIVKLGIVEDLDAFYKQSKISICPMLTGTGVKIKVLEALSFGIPVVTSRRGVDGLLNKTQNGCLVSQTEFEFARNIKNLLEDEAYHREIAAQGYSYFTVNHAEEKERKFLDAIFLNNND